MFFNTTRLARFAVKLQPYDYNIAYKNGKTHSDADCRPRHPTKIGTTLDELEGNEIPEGGPTDHYLCVIPFGELIEMQLSDSYLKEIHKKLTSPKLSIQEARNFQLKDGVIQYQGPFDDKPLLAVPTSLRELVMTEMHDYRLSGHLGFSKTYNKIRSRYWWPKLTKDIMEYIIRCSECQSRKTPTTLAQGLLIRTPHTLFGIASLLINLVHL